VFDVKMQGEIVLENVVLKAPGVGEIATIIRDIQDVQVKDQLAIELIPKQGVPSLSALEVHRIETSAR